MTRGMLAPAAALALLPALAVAVAVMAETPATRTDDLHSASRPRPLVAFVSGYDIVVADDGGATISRTRSEGGGFSLGGGLLAVVRPREDKLHTFGLDARTGVRRFVIRHTLATPTVLPDGRSVAFSGQGRRDRYATSLWLRDHDHGTRRLVRFGFGGSPGIPTGISEGTVLDYSFSEAGDVVAVVAGDEIVTFAYDIWTVDVATGEERRITNDFSSRYPAMSPEGERVAYFREERNCGGPMPGYRSGDLVLVDAAGTTHRVLNDGSCNRYVTRPRWLTSELLVGVLHTKRTGEAARHRLFDSEVVLLDADTGVVSQPISQTNRVGEISVSPSARRIAYNDWTRPKGFWVYQWEPDGAGPVDQVPWARGSSTRFDNGRAPHLRGDPTLNPSY